MAESIYKMGTKYPKAVRKSKSWGKGRMCSKDGCDKIMSQYNNSEFCFEHKPLTYPRNRGKILRD